MRPARCGWQAAGQCAAHSGAPRRPRRVRARCRRRARTRPRRCGGHEPSRLRRVPPAGHHGHRPRPRGRPADRLRGEPGPPRRTRRHSPRLDAAEGGEPGRRGRGHRAAAPGAGRRTPVGADGGASAPRPIAVPFGGRESRRSRRGGRGQPAWSGRARAARSGPRRGRGAPLHDSALLARRRAHARRPRGTHTERRAPVLPRSRAARRRLADRGRGDDRGRFGADRLHRQRRDPPGQPERHPGDRPQRHDLRAAVAHRGAVAAQRGAARAGRDRDPPRHAEPRVLGRPEALPGGGRGQRRDESTGGRHAAAGARTLRLRAGHDEQHAVRRRHLRVLRDGRRGRRRRSRLCGRQRRPHPHDEHADHRSGSAGASLSRASRAVCPASGVGRGRQVPGRRRSQA